MATTFNVINSETIVNNQVDSKL